QSGRAEHRRQHKQYGNHAHPEYDIAPCRVRPERHATPLQQALIPGAIGCRVHGTPRFRGFGYAVAQHQEKMETDEEKDKRRNEEDMKSKEAAKRLPPYRVAP